MAEGAVAPVSGRARKEVQMTDDPVLFSHRLADRGPQWIHLDANNPQARNWLESHTPGLEGLVIDALLAEEIRPRTVDLDHQALVALRCVNLNSESAPEDMVSIRVFADAGQIITTQKRQSQDVMDLERKISSGKGPENTGDFFNTLLARLSDRLEPVLTALEEATGDIEEAVLEEADINLRNSITQVRRTVIILRQHMAPQRDAIRQLSNLSLSWLDLKQQRRLRENHDRVTRYIEGLDTLRERAQIVKDEIVSIMADRLNQHTYILSVVAAIFLPLSFLTGLMGINTGGVPGAGHPWAFWLFCALLLVLVCGLILIFRRLKWF